MRALSVAISSFAALAAALPSTPAGELASDVVVDKRAIGGVYICTDINWGGECGYKVQPLRECISLTAPWLYTISSFGPDQGTYCVLYPDTGCDTPCEDPAGCRNIIQYPGSPDLRSFGSGWNDRIGSFLCEATG